MYTYKTGLSTSEHDRFVIDSPQTNLLQSSSWAKIKDSWGNDRLGFYQDGNLVCRLLLEKKKKKIGRSQQRKRLGDNIDYQKNIYTTYVLVSI